MNNPFHDPKKLIVSRTGEQAYKDYLARMKNEGKQVTRAKKNLGKRPITASTNLSDLNNFIQLNSVNLDGTPIDILVEKYVTQLNDEIKQALYSLGYLPQIKDSNGNITQAGYTNADIWIKNRLGSLNWYQQIPLLEHFACDRLDNRQFKDLRNLLANGLENRIKVLDGLNQELSKDEIQDILDKLLKKEDPWRSEYLDTRSEVTDDKVIIYSGHYTNPNLPLQERIKLENIKAKYKKEIPKNNIVMRDGWTSFSNLNEYGLAIALDDSNKEVYFWCPTNNSVAGFNANSDRAGLDCDRNPAYSDEGLGVRRAKILGEVK